MPDYVPSPREWVRDQVELYECSGGAIGPRAGGALGRVGAMVVLVVLLTTPIGTGPASGERGATAVASPPSLRTPVTTFAPMPLAAHARAR